ncbi:AAA family ATPase [Acinetobacter seifertii]|uniref:DUF3696 domain-containing protein n=1 Tax=Acinetobacter TaxID=469 RepID=UPI0002E6061A|nr:MULTISPECIES: DUF3696 domain-containing protein [Acinetobacter]MDQ9037172.1 AAA family ATPase [Acinetobacter seifertii]
MFDIKSIRLRNLRSLKDTKEINLKPITILVGKNSVGKSTFLRTFPLLRQSCEKETRTPILWYGNLVDYGDFGTSINRDAAKNEETNYIDFSFKLNVDSNLSYFAEVSMDGSVDIEISIQMKEYNKSSYASKLKLKFFDREVVIDLNSNQEFDKIAIGETEFDKEYFKEKGLSYKVEQRKFLPTLVLLKQYKIKDKRVEYINNSKFFEEMLVNKLRSLCRNNVKDETIMLLMKSIPFSSSSDIFNFLSKQEIISSVAKKITKSGINDFVFKEIVDYYYLMVYESITLFIDNILASTFSQVRYLEPLRATAQRYYRRQELAINEIDSKGSNIAMFLDSLSTSERTNLSNLLVENFNIELNVRRESGHLALTIKSPELKEDTNIADLGVGYSQILPFIIQLWDCNNRRRISRQNNFSFFGNRTNNNFFVVEQPELHLHPAYQAKIADVIDKVIDKNKLNLIIETHSPHLIYRFGELIEDENSNITKDDIQVLIFEEKNGETNISQAMFNDEGRLQNWPIGFFQP